MVVVLTMKQVYLCHQCAESDLLYQTYLAGQFGCGICKHPVRYDQQTRGRLYEYRPFGTVAVRTAQETRMFSRVEKAQVLLYNFGRISPSLHGIEECT